MALETEVKIYIADLDAIRAQFRAAGAHLAKPRIFERNLRYENAASTLRADGIVLRLRQDDRARLTYKEPSDEQQSTGAITRLELETEVGDFDAMNAILLRLGYYVSMIYEKYRTTYELAGAEIVLDEMPYGNFIEIEGTADQIETVIEKLGLVEAGRILGSYTYLFEVVKAVLGLEFRDLSFENFEGVGVPAVVFEYT